MARLIVAIHMPGPADKLRADIEEDKELRDSWFSPDDGEKILVDEASMYRSEADDSFFTFEYIGVEEDK